MMEGEKSEDRGKGWGGIKRRREKLREGGKSDGEIERRREK